jgi:hypothetical protein
VIAKRRPEHFEWLARYVIRGETPQEIARHPVGSTVGVPPYTILSFSGGFSTKVPRSKSARRYGLQRQRALAPHTGNFLIFPFGSISFLNSHKEQEKP